MSETDYKIDPTAFGLFLVAIVSLPLAIMQLKDEGVPTREFFTLMGILILVVSYIAYRNGSNFGFIVFGLVAAGVYFSGAAGGDLYINVTLGIIYLVALIWSYHLGNPKTLTIILLTTALIFIFGGVAVQTGDLIWTLLQGIAALANFVLTLYLAFALADEHLPCY